MGFTFDINQFRRSLQYTADSLLWLSESAERLERPDINNEGIFQVDTVTHTLELALSHARNLTNQRVPINKIPPEILGHVFEFLVERHFPICASRRAHSKHFAYDWTCVMQVCQHWRTVAMHAPSLWSLIQVIDLADPLTRGNRSTPELHFPASSLSRSGMIPLTVHLDLPVENKLRPSYALAGHILSQMRRIRELRLVLRDGDDGDMAAIIQHIDANSDAPCLEALSLHLESFSDLETETRHVTDYQPLHHLFSANQSPKLCTVSIENYYGWTRWSLRNLRHLYIGEQRNITEHHLKNLLDVISQNSRLECLVLYHIFLESNPHLGLLDTRKPYTMPCLKHVVVITCHTSVYYMVNHWVQLPAESARFYSTVGTQIHWHDIFHRDDMFDFTHIHLSPRKLLGRSQTSALCLYGGLPDSFTNILQDYVPLHKLRSLSISHGHKQPSGVNPVFWGTLLQRMTDVTSLTFGYGIPDWTKRVESTSAILPHLSEVRLHNVHRKENANFSSFLLRRSKHDCTWPELHITVGPAEPEQLDVERRWYNSMQRMKEVLPVTGISVESVEKEPTPIEVPDICVQDISDVEGFWKTEMWSEWN